MATISGAVQAFNSVTGAPIWSAQLGPRLRKFTVPCGGGSTFGVVGTPVIDAAQGAIYLDALTLENGAPQHELYGLSLLDGSVLPGWPVNVQQALTAAGYAFNPSVQDQHGGLALVGGVIYVAYGGMGGDCGVYHGWVLGLQETPPLLAGVWQTSGEWGGIWSPGGVTYDGASLFVTTGNTIKGTKAWSDGEAVIRLPFTLQHSADPHDYFVPANWTALDRADSDVGATGPLPIDVPLPGGGTAPMIFAINKGGTAYLLDRTNLGGVGHALLSQQVTTNQVRTAPAAYPSPDGVFVALSGSGNACPGGGANALTVLDVTDAAAPAIGTAWCAAFSGQGSPIATSSDGTADAMVWSLGATGDNLLHGFRGDTGTVLFAGGGPGDAMTGLRKFSTILAAEGRLFVAGQNQLYAFSPDPMQQ